MRQTPFAVKHQHPSLDVFGEEQSKRAKRLSKVNSIAKILGLEVIQMCQKESLF